MKYSQLQVIFSAERWYELPNFPNPNKWGYSMVSLNNDVYVSGESSILHTFNQNRQVVPQTVLELSDFLVQVWGDPPGHNLRVSHNLPEYYLAAKWTSLPYVFSQIFALSLSPWLIIFISMKQCAILSFLTRYPFHISIDIQHDVFSPLRADVFPMCFFHFLEHC